MTGPHEVMPYRIVARSPSGDRRIFFAKRIRLSDGWVEAWGSFRGATRPRLKISLPMTSVLYIEETSPGPLRHGWVRPRVPERLPDAPGPKVRGRRYTRWPGRAHPRPTG